MLPYGSSERERAGSPACSFLAPGGVYIAPRRRFAGELLPRLSILTLAGGIFLLHFPWSRLHRQLTCTLALRCSDFPHIAMPPSDYLAGQLKHKKTVKSRILTAWWQKWPPDSTKIVQECRRTLPRRLSADNEKEYAKRAGAADRREEAGEAAFRAVTA